MLRIGRTENLKPNKKGERRGGRKPGQTNKFTRELKEAVLYAANHFGMDGKGYGGLCGYLVRLAATQPTVFGGMLSKMLPMRFIKEFEHSFDLSKLNDDELAVFERIIVKSAIPLTEGPDIDPDNDPLDYSAAYTKRLSELMEAPIELKANDEH